MYGSFSESSDLRTESTELSSVCSSANAEERSVFPGHVTDTSPWPASLVRHLMLLERRQHHRENAATRRRR